MKLNYEIYFFSLYTIKKVREPNALPNSEGGGKSEGTESET